MEKKVYLKTDLVAELAASVGVSKRKTDMLLVKLAQIAYREAPNGFNVPGICRLDVVHRKERRARVPKTGEQILIGAHDALRVRPLRKAKNAVTPQPSNLVTVLPSDGQAAPDPVAAAPQPAPAAAADNPDQLVSFRCPSCSQEIEAPADMSGTQSECPTCGNEIEIPYMSEPGTVWGRALTEAEAAQSLPPPVIGDNQPQTGPMITEPSDAMKSRTIRIELPDDI